MSYIGNQITGFLGTGSLTVTTSTVAVEGDSLFSADGNVVLGDASGDTITINAATASIPNNLNIDSNTLFIDAANNRIGIGTTPSAILHTKSSGQLLRLESTAATGSAYLSYYDSSALKGHVGYTGGSDDDFNIFNAENSNIKLFTNSTQALVIDASQNVGIGTSSPDGTLHVKDAIGQIYIQSNDGQPAQIVFGDVSDASRGRINYDSSDNIIFENNNLAERMRIDSSGNVGIGNSIPSSFNASANNLVIGSGASGDNTGLTIYSNSNASGSIHFADSSSGSNSYVGDIFYNHTDNYMAFLTSATEAMRIDSSGNLLVGKTSSSFSVAGIGLMANDQIFATATSDNSLALNRLSTDGDIAKFYKDSSTVGSISTIASTMYLGTGNCALRFNDTSLDMRPVYSTGLNRDNAIDLGTSAARFKDLFLSGSVYLGGTGSANALDDYEEGTYSASLVAATSGSIFMTTGSTTLSYVKIGDIVHVQGYLRVDSVSSPTGRIHINLPFTAKSGAEYRSAAVVSFNSIASGNIADMWAIVVASTSKIDIYKGDSTSVQADSANAMQAGTDVRIYATYQAA
jgi:hypothetical protein